MPILTSPPSPDDHRARHDRHAVRAHPLAAVSGGIAPFTALAALAALTACGAGGSGDPTTNDVTVTDSAGVRIVTTAATDRAYPDTLVEIGTIGRDDGTLFANLYEQAVTTDGRTRIAVLEGDDARVRLFTIGDGEGAPVLRVDTVGRRGGGPGEFQFAGSVAIGDDGAIEVHDFGKNARVAFDADGTPGPERTLSFAMGRLDTDARFAGDTMTGLVTVVDDSAATREIRLVRATPDDTAVLRTVTQPVVREVAFESCSLRMRNTAPLFSARPQWVRDDARLLFAPGDAYRLEWYEGGALTAVWTRPIPVVPTEPGDVDALYPDGLRMRAGSLDCRVPAEEIAREWGLAPTRPAVEGVTIAPDGSVWVQRYVLPGAPPKVDVFAADGAYRGTIDGIALPYGFLTDGRLVLDARDPDTDEPYLRVMRLANAGW
jgi:hypothetical protein